MNLLTVGTNPNYWYPVVRARRLGRGEKHAISAWGQHVVVYRDEQGAVHALENRCLHRGVALHEGQVVGRDLVCPYHGWTYDCEGRLKDIPYLEEKKRLPRLCVTSYPVREAGGLIWLFPGDRGRSSSVSPPDTSGLESDEWISFCLDNDFRNHYAIGLVNGMDYFHFHLHGDYQPWRKIEVTDVTTEEDAVHGVYRITSESALSDRIFNWMLGARSREPIARSLKVHVYYPHHLAEVNDDLKVWVFFLPLKQDLVRVFITMYVRSKGISRLFQLPFRKLFSPLILKRIQAQDAWGGRLEQAGWERYPNAPRCEVNKISMAVEKLITRKWEQACQTTLHAARPERDAKSWHASSTPASLSPVEDAAGGSVPRSSTRETAAGPRPDGQVVPTCAEQP